MKQPLVSVIIPSLNSGKFLRECLESIKKQIYQNIEIIIVDNNSKDNTREIAKRYTKHVFIHGPERAAQVNFGAAKALGKYLYRVDADFVLEQEVISQCVRECEQKKLDAIAVHNTSGDGLGFWADVRKLERNSYRDDDLIVGVRFFTKKAWEKIGGFDENLYGPEDYDFHIRLVKSGFKWGRIKAIERHLGEPKSLSDIARKHYWYGKQMLFYFKKHPVIATQQFNPVRTSYFRHYEIFLKHPMLLIGLIIMNFVKFLAGGLGFASAFITQYNPKLDKSKSKLVH